MASFTTKTILYSEEQKPENGVTARVEEQNMFKTGKASFRPTQMNS